MKIHPFQILALPNGAKLIFTPCPGTKLVSLEDSILQLKKNQTSMLITLMPEEEMVANDVIALPSICHKHQITWLQLPIVDDEAPASAFELQWLKHKQSILDEIVNQGVVAVHCKGGTGRTGTVISMLLLQLGWSVCKIVSEVQAIKPKALKIQAQLDYLNTQLVNTRHRINAVSYLSEENKSTSPEKTF
ncbi:protein-tyrosine phosphatase family protein [Thalassotalea psychrophila]|uniref:Protein-tyrosine phosphatase family protein n=1 Tax=Thalassotalea psychrophila TaxID=3065647 RepID=A0ABY9TSG4_9GAMM|nr:protein-tyrosine phosphatase family protein [Colwelliaceae bacterium SQ149]